MNTGIYESQFAKVFSNILGKYDISCYKISKYANLDEAYLSRLRNGLKSNPSPEVVIRISLALVHYSKSIRQIDIETLFHATGRTLFPKSRGY